MTGSRSSAGLNGGKRFSPAAFRNLVAYICGRDPEIETAKLCWSLFWIDMEAYRKLGRSITGCVYVKGGDGYPIPCRRSKPRPSRAKAKPA